MISFLGFQEKKLCLIKSLCLYCTSLNSFALLKHLIFVSYLIKNCPWHRAKRDAIEFERSENQGQFFNLLFFIILILLKDFKPSETLI